MEKRAILAIVLSLVVVVVWSIVFAPSTPPPSEFDESIPPEVLSPGAPLPAEAPRPCRTIVADWRRAGRNGGAR